MTNHVKNKVRRICRDVSYSQLSARKVCILERSNSETASRLVCTVHIRFCCFVSVCAMYFNLSFSVWQCWHSLRWHYVSYTLNRGVHAGTLFFSVCILLRKENEEANKCFGGCLIRSAACRCFFALVLSDSLCNKWGCPRDYSFLSSGVWWKLCISLIVTTATECAACLIAFRRSRSFQLTFHLFFFLFFFKPEWRTHFLTLATFIAAIFQWQNGWYKSCKD